MRDEIMLKNNHCLPQLSLLLGVQVMIGVDENCSGVCRCFQLQSLNCTELRLELASRVINGPLFPCQRCSPTVSFAQ